MSPKSTSTVSFYVICTRQKYKNYTTQKQEQEQNLCYTCFSPPYVMLHASLYAQIMPCLVAHPNTFLSTQAMTGLTSCQTNWHLNRHIVSGRTAAGTLLMMHLPLHSPPTATAAAIEGPWYTGLALILRFALGTSHAGWSLPDSSSLKNHTQNWRCRMNSHVDWVIHTLNGPHGATDTLY